MRERESEREKESNGEWEKAKRKKEKGRVNIIKILSKAITSRFKTDDSSMFLSY